MANLLPGEWDWMEKVGLGQMPPPSAVTTPIKAEGRLAGLARRFGENLFPMIGAEQIGMNPAQVMQAQRAARKQLGLGMLANVGSGNSFGEGLGSAMGLAQYGLQQGMDRQQAQYALEQRKAQQEREDAYRAERDAVGDERFALQQQQRVADQAAAQAQEERNRTELTAWQQAQLDEGRRDRAMRGGLGAPPSGWRWRPDGSQEPVPGGPYDPAVLARKQAPPLRKEFRSLQSVKDYEAVLSPYESAKNAPDTGPGDLLLIYTVGKVLDPGSVVREGELALIKDSGSPLQQVLGTTRFTTEKGGRLTPKQRQQMMAMLEDRVGAVRSAYERDYAQYGQYARELGVDPSEVVGSHASSAYGDGGGSGIDDLLDKYAPR